MDAPGPTIADRYELGEVLGRGGMSEVRAGRDLRLGRDVAIKLLTIAGADASTMRERFEAEARAVASLSHPNVVLVFDSGEHEGVPFLVMERLPGRTLADEMAAGPLPPDRAARPPLMSSLPSAPHTQPGSCTVTSSRATCCSTRTAGQRCPTSASPRQLRR